MHKLRTCDLNIHCEPQSKIALTKAIAHCLSGLSGLCYLFFEPRGAQKTLIAEGSLKAAKLALESFETIQDVCAVSG